MLVVPPTGVVDGVVAARPVDGEDGAGTVLGIDPVEVLREVSGLAEDTSEPVEMGLHVKEGEQVRLVTETKRLTFWNYRFWYIQEGRKP